MILRQKYDYFYKKYKKSGFFMYVCAKRIPFRIFFAVIETFRNFVAFKINL